MLRISLLITLAVLPSCGTARVSELEKKVETLSAKLEQQTREGDFSMQLRCKKSAGEVFVSQGLDKEKHAAFVNHYSQQLKKCFAVLKSSLIDTSGVFVSRYLFNAAEQKELGECFDIRLKGQPRTVNPCYFQAPSGERREFKSLDEFETQVEKTFLQN